LVLLALVLVVSAFSPMVPPVDNLGWGIFSLLEVVEVGGLEAVLLGEMVVLVVVELQEILGVDLETFQKPTHLKVLTEGSAPVMTVVVVVVLEALVLVLYT
jgi:hypothetical protein